MSDEQRKIDGQRKSIREHIDKFKRYAVDHEKAFALKTIENAQLQIRKIKQRKPNVTESWEDEWTP